MSIEDLQDQLEIAVAAAAFARFVVIEDRFGPMVLSEAGRRSALIAAERAVEALRLALKEREHKAADK